MAKKLTKAHLAITLATIAAAGADGMFVPPLLAEKLSKEGFIEVNPDPTAVDEYGCVGARVTEEGASEAAKVETTEAPVEAETTASFEIEDNVEIPKGTRGRASASKYPFDKLEIGQSFFVADNPKMKDTARTMGSVVSREKKRYAVETGEMKEGKNGSIPVLKYERNFICRPVEGGARVWRIALSV